jgi:mycothiol synthase
MPTLKRFDPEVATDAYFKARHKYLNLRRQEHVPDDPPRSLESTIKNAKSWKLFEKAKFEVWHLWEGDDIIAELFIEVAFLEENRHLMEVDLEVFAPYRRQGYAKGLLPKIIEAAQQYERTLVISPTISTVPAGGVFAQRLGATKGMETHTNQLVLSEVNPARLEDWVEQAKTTARAFELGWWGNTYPEEDIAEIARLMEVMNTQPRDDLEMEDWKVEPERLRQGEAYNKARGVERRVLYARHKNGELAAFTETYWDPENPENLRQGDTGVIPKYRGHGLGKWLKAAMIQKVLAERPIVKRIRTGNADSNAGMLAINNALGFKPYIAGTVWQIEIETLKSYLGRKDTSTK